NVLLRYHQDVGGRLGIDVLKGIGVLVLVNLLGRNMAGNDFAKQAVAHKSRRRTRLSVPRSRYHARERLGAMIQSNLTRKIPPSLVLVARAPSWAPVGRSFFTRTRTHHAPTGLGNVATLAV